MERKQPLATAGKENKSLNSRTSNQAKVPRTIPVEKASAALGKQTVKEEEKKESTKTGLFTQKPSQRFAKVKAADPFSSGKKHKTNFGYVYSAGGVPCRINHGSVTNKIKWDTPPQELDYDPLLINCFEGLLETDHPYNLVATKAVTELLEANRAAEKTIPIVQKVIMPLRNAFLSNDKTIWLNGLEALRILSETVGHHLTPHIHILLAQLNKKMINKAFREKVLTVLNIIEEQGGKEALDVLRAKIPTYSSIYS